VVKRPKYGGTGLKILPRWNWSLAVQGHRTIRKVQFQRSRKFQSGNI